ncbi:MAG: hypothetical protein QM831_13010 [Kofleriaceae bacterium]
MTARTSICCRPDRPELAIGSEDGSVVIVSFVDGTLTNLDNLGAHVARTHWSTTGLFVGALNGMLHVRSADGRELRQAIDTGHGAVRGLAVHDNRFVTCGYDAKAALWDVGSLQKIVETPVPKSDRQVSATACALVPGAIVVGYSDGFFEAWNDTSLENLAGGEVFPSEVYAMGVNAERSTIVMGGSRGKMVSVIAQRWVAGTVWKNTPPKPIAVNSIEFRRRRQVRGRVLRRQCRVVRLDRCSGRLAAGRGLLAAFAEARMDARDDRVGRVLHRL